MLYGIFQKKGKRSGLLAVNELFQISQIYLLLSYGEAVFPVKLGF